MKPKGLWGHSSRTFALLLLAVTVPPATTLVWLGVQLLQQDRSLLAQRDFERRQASIRAVTHSLQLSLAEAERRPLDDPVPEGAVRFRMSANGVEARPADRVLWLPVPRAARGIENGQCADAERFEFQGSADRAIAMYTDAARSAQPATRAGALLRLARALRSQRRWNEALSAYRDLERVRDVTIEGAAADLQAQRASCAVLAELGRTRELGQEAARLEADLMAGRWTLDRPAWELTAGEIEQWTGHSLRVTPERRLFSAVADTLWSERQRSGQPRRIVLAESTPVTVLWRVQPTDVLALAISPVLLRAWTERAIADGVNGAARLSLLTASGERLAGPVPVPGSAAVSAPMSDTGLPWTLVLSPGDASSATAELANRRRLLSELRGLTGWSNARRTNPDRSINARQIAAGRLNRRQIDSRVAEVDVPRSVLPAPLDGVDTGFACDPDSEENGRSTRTLVGRRGRGTVAQVGCRCRRLGARDVCQRGRPLSRRRVLVVACWAAHRVSDG